MEHQGEPAWESGHVTNVFVLSTGRCGSATFAKACSHFTNFTAGHETNAKLVSRRLEYPPDHIEVDNRLSWFLGLLDERYPNATCVHLRRDPEKVAASYARRFNIRAGIMSSFAQGVIRSRVPPGASDRLAVARLYVDTVEANIRTFLRDRRPGDSVITIDIDDPQPWFDLFCSEIGAEGDLDAAARELSVIRNGGRR